MTSDPRWRGVYPHGTGWRAVVSRGRSRAVVTRHFPKDTPLATMQDWRKDEQAKARLQRKTRAAYGTFEGDAKRYLGMVAGLASFRDRKLDIERWIAVFGTRARDTITPGDISAQRDRWAKEPRATDDDRPFAASTINHRLRALANLYTLLDGRRADNPALEVEELSEPAPRVRAMPYQTVEAIIAALPDRGRPEAGKRPKVSATKVRIRCLAYSQITPKQLMRLTPADLDLAHAGLHLPARAKGRGAAAVWVPLLPKAVAAFKDFHRLKLYGPFAYRSLRHTWDRAAKKAGALGARPYDLRHSYGTLVYRATGSREAVQQLLQHASWDTSARYAIGAEDEIRRAHGDTVVRHFGTTALPDTAVMARFGAVAAGTGTRGDQRRSGQKARKR